MNRDFDALTSGLTSCGGCGEAIAMRIALAAAGPNIIVTNATGCSEIFTSRYPDSAWNVPWIHSLFENPASVGSGIAAALKALGKEEEARVIACGGDGATADIGIGCLSGTFERNDDVLYFCWDNEAYMNTGIQRSALTPFYGSTTTSPAGKVIPGNLRPKKDMPAIAMAHGIPYVATASVGYPRDLQRKVKRAMEIRGARYIQVHATCPLGWGTEPAKTVDIAKLAVQTGLYPLFEAVDGKIVKVQKIKPVPVEEYLKTQKRFRHLFRDERGKEIIKEIQAVADANIAKFNLR